MREAILLYTTVAMGPMLPEGEKTRGEKILRPSEAVVLLSVLLSGVPAGIVKRSGLLTTSLRVL